MTTTRKTTKRDPSPSVVKFHSVGQSVYDAAAAATKKESDLYFTDENRLYKGTSIVGAANLFTLNVGEAASLVDPNADGCVITPPATGMSPVKGDVLIVTRTLATDKFEKTAYTWNGSWVACDGNVSADNVVMTKNLTLTANVGVHTMPSTGSKTLSTTGKSVAQTMDMLFAEEKNPSATAPAVTLKINGSASDYSQSLEYGATTTSQKVDATLSAGSYTYNATGITAKSWSIATGEVNGESKSTTESSKAAGWLPTMYAGYGTQSYTVTATATYDAGATPLTNLGNEYPTAQIAAGSKSQSRTVKVTAYRNNFYKSFAAGSTVDASSLTSADVRSYSKTGSASLPTSITTVANFQQVLIFVPTSLNKSAPTVTDTATNLPQACSKLGTTIQVAGAADTVTINGVSNDTRVSYDVFQILNDAGYGAGKSTTLSLAW